MLSIPQADALVGLLEGREMRDFFQRPKWIELTVGRSRGPEFKMNEQQTAEEGDGGRSRSSAGDFLAVPEEFLAREEHLRDKGTVRATAARGRW